MKTDDLWMEFDDEVAHLVVESARLALGTGMF
jgi:hypothetical protein